MKPLLGGLLLVGLSGLFLGTMSLSASAEVDDYIRNSAPQGIRLNNIFETAKFDGNSAQVSQAPAGKDQADIVNITQQPNQLGAIWSKDNYKFDLKKDAKASMWLYFGGGGARAADGMALVLQNSKDGTNAISKTDKGESLGVWGQDFDNNSSTNPQTISGTAIQNSWALEFDTNSNQSQKVGDAFDMGEPVGMHIAENYPGESSSYSPISDGGWFFRNYFYKLNHNHIISNLSLANGKWHHLSLQWEAPKSGSRNGFMTYTFDDKDPTTGRTITNAPQQTAEVDCDKFHSADDKVYWGFTGATGKRYERAYVIFEGIPDVVNARATLSLKNMTTQQDIVEGSQVTTGDKLQYDYDLKYLNGVHAWSKIQADLPLDAHFKFKSGVLTYDNGQTQTVTASDIQNNHLKFDFANDLSTSNNHARLTLTGVAENTQPDTIVTMQQINQAFRGLNQIINVDAPDYHVVGQRLVHLLLADDQVTSNLTFDRHHNAMINGRIFYRLGEWTNAGIDQVTVKLNDKVLTVPDQLKWSWSDSETGNSGKFNLIVPWRYLHTGTNQMSLRVTDKTAQQSNEVQVTINVPRGQLTLSKVATQSAFQPVAVNGQPQHHIGRQSDWQVVVDDERGTGSRWQLQAHATQPVDAHQRPLNVDVVFNNGSRDQSLIRDNVIVMDHEATTDDDEQHIAAQWAPHQGVLLNVSSGAVPGNYQTTIHWTLNDVPTTE
ncbi:L-type lectin family protein [Lactiplantibacillus songbeiensis]|uniref:Extracellular protein n=1 Tax=Lactiplantibacillus songbeiensis TaxID=2559920 RepID=A0ABW4C242_9LACO|nr:hypothetical protein [Lactiplantibacillus songbeiensis]